MTEIFVKSNSLVEVQTYFRIKNFDGNDISNFILIGLILGIAALLIGTIICIIINYHKKLPKINVLFIVIINFVLFYYKRDFNKPAYYLSLDFINDNIKLKIVVIGIIFFLISILLFYFSSKSDLKKIS